MTATNENIKVEGFKEYNITITPKKANDTYPIETIDTIGYIIGWICGIFQALFWIILLIIYLIDGSHGPTKFFSLHAKKFITYYGYVCAIILFVLFLCVIL